MSFTSKVFFSQHFLNVPKHVNRTFSLTRSVNSCEAKVVKSDSSDIVLPDIYLTVPEAVVSAIGPYEKYTAVECGITGKKYTFEQVRTKAFNLGKSLRKLFRLSKGNVVAVHLPNIPECFVTTLGILSGGCVITTLNPIYTYEEIARQLLDADAKVIITYGPSYNQVKLAVSLLKKHIPVIVVKEKESDSLPDSTINFHDLTDNSKIADLPDIVTGKGNELASLPYSSGTTGLPKGVLITHHNLLSNLRQFGHVDFNMHVFPEGDAQDIVPMVLPFYHIFGFTVGILNSFMFACKVITLPRFTPNSFISVLKKYKITHLYGAPPLILFITSSPDVRSEYFSQLKIVTSGAAPLGYSDEIRFTEKIKNKSAFIRQGYGLTETSPVITSTPVEVLTSEKIRGSIGKLIPNTEAKIIAPDDPTGTPLGPNQQGEMLIKGPQVTVGYHNKVEETKNSFLDGWFRTGDMSYYNDERFFFITDRLKELIKVKGYQVPPAELEALIRSYPAVEDAAVIGIPDAAQGELPRAYVVVKKGERFSAEELQKFVASKVAKYKQLAGGVKILDVIPKNPSGKILRRQLKEDFNMKGI